MEPLLILDELRSPGGGRPQYGTSMHYPDCHVNATGCTGCLPPVLEGEVVGPAAGPMYGVIPGSRWDAAVDVDYWATPGEWLVGVDVAADPADRSLVFAQVRDGIVRVHVPEVR